MKLPKKAPGWLWDGAQAAYQQRTQKVTAWIARGRRDDLTGWTAALGSWVRITILAAAAYGLWRFARACPWLLWIAAAWWIRCSWKADRPVEQPEEEPPGPDPADTIRALLWQLIGDAPGVHLRDVLAYLQKEGHHPTWTVADLRRHLELHGIPIDPKLKLSGTPTRGVRRDALGTPPPAIAQARSPQASPAV